jgi:hypothetical protein
LEQGQGVLPVWPKAPQANPKQAIRRVKLGFSGLAMEHGKLKAERQVFKHEPGMGSEFGEHGS